jgi:hypothetical protein
MRLFALIAALGLTAVAGCTHMPLTSMVRLARVDFTATDPAQVRAAVKLPRAVVPKPHGMAMRVAVKLANGDEEFQDFHLREVSEPNDLLALHRELDPGAHIFAYRLDAGEAARLAAFRDALKKKQEASKGGGELTIAIRPDACRIAELGNGPVFVTTYLRTAETGGYVPLTHALDLRNVDPKRDIAAAIPPCA